MKWLNVCHALNFFQTNLTFHFLGLTCHSERIKKISMNHKTIISYALKLASSFYYLYCFFCDLSTVSTQRNMN